MIKWELDQQLQRSKLPKIGVSIIMVDNLSTLPKKSDTCFVLACPVHVTCGNLMIFYVHIWVSESEIYPQ